MNTKTQLTISAQALEESIGGQAACLRAVELTLEALAQPEPEVAMMREWKPRRMSAEEMQSENTRLQASLEECSGNCTALKDQVRRMRSELERPMSSEATVLVHDNARLRAEVQALREALAQPAAQPTDQDDAAVDAFCVAMKEKLRLAKAKGRCGWQDCPKEDLSRMLREHVEKGDPRDVANFCMFLHTLGYGIEPAAQCTNSDTWNCKYCRKTETCEALKDPRNFASAAQPAAQPTEPAKDIGVEQDERVFARIAAMKAQPPEPQKTTPSYIDGYNAGMADAKRMAQQEPAGEPVAFQVVCDHCGGTGNDPKNNNYVCSVCEGGGSVQKMLYTRPAVPLSDEQIIKWVESGEYNVTTNDWASHIAFARAIEAAHKIGGAE